MNNQYKNLKPQLKSNYKIFEKINDYKLCAFLIAFEGWKRGLHLKWYHAQYNKNEIFTMNEKTNGKLFSLENKKVKHFFYRSRGDKVSDATVKLCFDKNKTKDKLKNNKVNVPEGNIFDISEMDNIINYANKLRYPVVLKPLDGSMGRGVFVNIKNEQSLRDDIKQFKKSTNYKKCILEKYYEGKDYRFYVVDNKVISVIYRIPANVTGDGEKNIKELIEQKNKKRKSNPYLANKQIKIDYEIKKILNNKNITLQYIPKLKERVILRESGNLSLGGDSVDCTNEISNEVKTLAINALKSINNMPHAGVDIIINPKDNTQGVVLEINGTAEIGLHSFPMHGEAKDVPSAIVDYYFPETINNKKSLFYFEYLNILNLLNNHTLDYAPVMDAPIGRVYCRKYILYGKVQKVGLLNWIQKEALNKKLYGYGYNIDATKTVIYLYTTKKNELDKFVERCKKGNKRSNIKKVAYYDINTPNNCLFPMGFEIKRSLNF